MNSTQFGGKRRQPGQRKLDNNWVQRTPNENAHKFIAS